MQQKDPKEFETWRDMRSTQKSLNLPEKDSSHRIIVVNGMNTKKSDLVDRAKAISKEIGGYNVHYVYNGSHGLLADCFEWKIQRLGFDTSSSNKVVKCVRRLTQDMDGEHGGGMIHIYAHSQGGETVNSARPQLTQVES